MTDLRPAASTLQLAAGFDRALIRRGGDSVRFLVVDVTAPTVEAEKTPAVSKAPLNLALVIDASGSMQGTPIAAAKEAARRVAASLGAADRLSVVSFDSEATRRAASFAAVPVIAALIHPYRSCSSSSP